jgi:hypothetical protein
VYDARVSQFFENRLFTDADGVVGALRLGRGGEALQRPRLGSAAAAADAGRAAGSPEIRHHRPLVGRFRGLLPVRPRLRERGRGDVTRVASTNVSDGRAAPSSMIWPSQRCW